MKPIWLYCNYKECNNQRMELLELDSTRIDNNQLKPRFSGLKTGNNSDQFEKQLCSW